jgi:hypothetical protein
MDSGIVKSTLYDINKDTDGNKLMCNVEVSDPDDVPEIEIINQAGIKTRPLEGARSIIIRCGGGYKVSIGVDDNIDEEIEEGEVLIYSNNNGSISASVKLLTDGTIEINNGSDFAVRYSALETAFNELNDKYNSHITEYNSHVHSGVTAGSASTAVTVPSTKTSTADIAQSKIEDILVP